MYRIAASFLLTSLAGATTVVGDEWDVTVFAGQYDRMSTPIVTSIPAELKASDQFSMVDTDTGRDVPVQASISKHSRELAWVLQTPLRANAHRHYRLRVSRASHGTDESSRVQVVEQDGHFIVRSGGRPVLQYNARLNRSPTGESELQARNAYIHPLFSPDGTVITDDFAPDHLHQRGLFFAWTKCRQANRDLNFWEIQQGTAKIEHVGLRDIQSGNVFAQFVAEHRFVDTNQPSASRTVLTEDWTVRVYHMPQGFLFDLKSDQRGVDDEPLIIGPYHYGGLAIRGRREWIDPLGESSFSMVTSEGLGRTEGNHTRPKWVDFGGRLQASSVGLTAFGHPDNDRFPQPVRLHPSKPYFCFAPLVQHEIRIAKGTTYTSRYRFHVYSGPKDPKRNRRLWHDYADPPKVLLDPISAE